MSFRTVAILACALALAAAQPSVGQGDAHDYPSLGRIEGYKITSYEEKRFDQLGFDLPDRKMTVEGHVIMISYSPDGSEPSASALEICRSYKAVLDALGGEILRYDETNGCGLVGRFTRNGGNVFVNLAVYGNGSDVRLGIVEEKTFRPLIQKPVPPSPKP